MEDPKKEKGRDQVKWVRGGQKGHRRTHGGSGRFHSHHFLNTEDEGPHPCEDTVVSLTTSGLEGGLSAVRDRTGHITNNKVQ